MKQIFAQGLYTGEKWIHSPLIELNDVGEIVAITEAKTPQAVGAKSPHKAEVRPGYFLPGLVNAHSHSFQYAMVGRSEFITTTDTQNDFWTWRRAMYHLALSLSKEAIQAITTKLYSELLCHGYTEVVEFHYLHHDVDGSRYSNSTAHIEALSLAALESGIRLTIVPVYYAQGNFSKTASSDQQRFLFSSTNEYREFLTAARETLERAQVGMHILGKTPRLRLGWGIHSLRAVDAKDIQTLFADRPNSGPMHIHIAEQAKEVEDCKEALGARPVEWLLSNCELTANDCLVHATHLTESETKNLATSAAQVVLCPTTEGNLGDGFFPIESYAAEGGRWSIGSDSHINLSPWEELRWLDYQARLRTRSRNPLAIFADDGHSGTYLWQNAWANGHKATDESDQGQLGRSGRALSPGVPFDAIYMEDEHLKQTPPEMILDYLIFHAGSAAVQETYVQGRRLVKEAQHGQLQSINQQFASHLREVWKGLWPKTH